MIPPCSDDDSPNPSNHTPADKAPARIRWGKDSTNALRFVLYRAMAEQEHGKVDLTPSHVELRPVDDDISAPPLPTSLALHPMEHGKHTHVPNNGAKKDSNTHIEQLGMKKAMRQARYEIRCLHMTKSNVKGKTVDIIHRPSGQEEEILRFELRKIIRDERDRDEARAAPKPPIHNIGLHAVEEVAQGRGGWHCVPCYGGGEGATPGHHTNGEEFTNMDTNIDHMNTSPAPAPKLAVLPGMLTDRKCWAHPMDRLTKRQPIQDVGDHG